MKISQILLPTVFAFGVDFRGKSNRLFENFLTKNILGYQNHLKTYHRKLQFSSDGYKNEIPWVLKQGRSITIFGDAKTPNEKMQEFELGFRMAQQELFYFDNLY